MASGKALAMSPSAGVRGDSTAYVSWLLRLTPVLAALAWAYAEPMQRLFRMWINEPDYNHGFFVPLFSIYLLWFRRGSFDLKRAQGSWWGLPVLLFALGLRWISAYFFYPTMDGPSLIPCLAGLVLLIGGWEMLRWAWPSLAFLVFMLPLPAGIAGLFSYRLQLVATNASTWLLQLLGVPAISQGNVIRLTHGEFGVVEACSGLRMLMLFLALTVGAAFLIRRPLWEKLLVAASALAIGIVTNILRITVTALLYEYVGEPWAQAVFHDLAGWLMMPVATLLLGLELWLLSQLLLAPDATAPVVMVGEPQRPQPSVKHAVQSS